MLKPRLRRFTCTLVLLWAVTVTGCVASRLREAQDSFNRGASLENATQFAAANGREMTDATAVETNYRLALAIVNKDLAKNESSLREDNLYGTALILKALCLWRLADLDGDADREAEAKKAALEKKADGKEDSAKKDEGDKLDQLIVQINTLTANKEILLGTRDQVLLFALPKLRDHDRGLRAKTYDEAAGYFNSALDGLQLSVKGVQPAHPIRAYIGLAQLSCYVSLLKATFAFHTHPEAEKLMEPINLEFDKAVLSLKPLWTGDLVFYNAVAKICTAMGRTPPSR